MVRAVHHHHGASGCIGPCDCANPLDDERSWNRARPAPTLLPGPGEGGDPDNATPIAMPIAMPIAGPGVTRGELARRWHPGERQELRRHQPALVVWAIGGTTGLVVALLPTAVAVVVTVGIWVCAALAKRYLGGDRVPAARMLRR